MYEGRVVVERETGGQSRNGDCDESSSSGGDRSNGLGAWENQQRMVRGVFANDGYWIKKSFVNMVVKE